MAKKKNSVAPPVAEKISPPLRLEYVDPATLDDNPMNWRTHPSDQLNALDAVLEDPSIGWAGALLYNERTSRLIDGHGRKEAWTAKHPGKLAPVLIGSWTEEAEQRILQTLDPIGAMAEANAVKLEQLRAAAPLSGEAFTGLQARLDAALADAKAKLQTIVEPPPERASTSAGGNLAAQYKIIIECTDEMQQTELLDELDRRGIQCKAVVA